MKKLALTCLILLQAVVLSAAEPEKLLLWMGKAPVGSGGFEEADAILTVHRPEKPNGTAVVICPGGGYGGLVRDAEGHGIAKWLNTHGITGAVLEYRLPAGRCEVPLLDAQRALRTLRVRAGEWGLRTDRIGIMGFSAGGHLASTAGVQFDLGDPSAPETVGRMSSRPDFQILIYPVVSMESDVHAGSRLRLLGETPPDDLKARFSAEKCVTRETAPAFLAHAVDDRPVPIENSRKLHLALQEAGVESRLLELPSGGHGLNGYKGPMWDAWQTESVQWLKKIGMVPAN
jgi:acetyl esterase/lipase